ncbi:hypothetical protein IMG5_063840 [Ichthyophthirius multifiliis]|uniref:UMP/CMP kinase n=1 Tax=Ichthyophthirius multifiliis TaxID=5932 RepID=G0QP47_ICHMU|nr:hypothetical protein IMG5_063840 [Ichthyophthirius multifiliis]EGR33013.1 hypothetical protein IMG5_063840 [Ichthyophthirius multifiliis]|eukprot:XP_004036999.1 hypothetical protein IMG5_063840 [Ichthyophthirius multifiliis]
MEIGPGAGKGTQCAKLVQDKGYIHLSAGDLLREERQNPNSQQGELIESYIKEGKIVPSEITVALLKLAMEKNGWSKQFLIDGFPRNFENLEKWNLKMGNITEFQCVLFLDCNEETMIQRILKRSENSGRSDDNIDSLKKRLKTYEESTKLIIEYYQQQGKIIYVNAEQTSLDVSKEIYQKLQL